MAVEKCEVAFDDEAIISYERVNFKNNGWLGAFDGEAWHYFPPHRIEYVRSLKD